MKRLALIVVGALGVAALFLVWTYWWSPGPKPGPHDIVVSEGSTLARVADQLDERGAIPGSAMTFRAMAKLFGSSDPVQAGEFEIPKGTSAAGILDILQHGNPVQRLITVTEGMPVIVVEEKLKSNRFLAGAVPDIPEGSLLPDSYSYQRGEQRSKVVQRMQAAMNKALAQLWPRKSGYCQLENVRQAVTLASIVEKETGKPSERPMIAGVYCNRLRIGMKLDADPTIIYPITKGKPLGRRIRESELHSDNPYNTYTHSGLPPGPIANPGRASIEAVLHPAATNALYFVADGTGGHVFAETLEQQNANVKRWYAIRRKRGEM